MARPRISETPLSAAERKRRQREKSSCHETCHETKPSKLDTTAKAKEILKNIGADEWDKDMQKYVAAKLIADLACNNDIGDLVMIYIMERIGKKRIEYEVSE